MSSRRPILACDVPPGSCGRVDDFGECVKVPDVCMTVEIPVCGCDGKTYTNDCFRLKAGARKAHGGAC